MQDIGDKFSRRHSTVLKGIASVERELRRESPSGVRLPARWLCWSGVRLYWEAGEGESLSEERLPLPLSGFLPPFPKDFDFIESLFAAFPVGE